jgi:guanine deaminase
MAGGYSLSILHTIAEAIKVSKLRWRLVDETLAPLSLPEAFYLATRGGGSFFGQVGSFEVGFEFDAVVFDDISLPAPRPFSLEERLSRLVYLGGDASVSKKYVAGKAIDLQ